VIVCVVVVVVVVVVLHLGTFQCGGVLGNDSLVHVADLEPADGLEQSSPVVTSGEVGVLQHLLRDLSVELGGDVAQV